MHELVLDHHREDAPIPGHEMRPGPLRHRVHGFEHRGPDAITIGEHLGHGRPAIRDLRVSVAVAGVVHIGIDAAGEELIERGVEGGPCEDTHAHVVPGEGGEVPDIEDERVAQRDRLGEEGPGREDLEDPVRARPYASEPLTNRLSHGEPPYCPSEHCQEVYVGMGPTATESAGPQSGISSNACELTRGSLPSKVRGGGRHMPPASGRRP